MSTRMERPLANSVPLTHGHSSDHQCLPRPYTRDEVFNYVNKHLLLRPVGIAKKNRGVISSTDEELLLEVLTKEPPMC